MQDVDEKFYERADAHIHLSNEQVSDEVGRGKVSASFMFAMARYNAYVSATGCDTKEDMIALKEEQIEYFVGQYRKMFEENYDDHVEEFEEYMGVSNQS
ncbi:MAG: hypothetical protein ACJAUP_003746 [Cellvibrionaceae bacterium]|jgi:hypothetical protein